MRPKPAWHITLHATTDTLPQSATAVRIAGDATARVVAATEQIALDIALASTSLADARWSCWQVIRKLRALYGAAGCTLAAGEGVTDDTVVTIALDLLHAFKG